MDSVVIEQLPRNSKIPKKKKKPKNVDYSPFKL